MKELIIKGLADANIKANESIPLTKRKQEKVSINHVDPLTLDEFIKKNNIPDNVSFDIINVKGGYGEFTEPSLSWWVVIDTTEEDKLEYLKKRFNAYAFPIIRDILRENGYKRIISASHCYRKYQDTTVYDMYVNKEFDRLVEYYSLSFERK